MSGESLGSLGETFVDVRADFTKLKADLQTVGAAVAADAQKIGIGLLDVGKYLTAGVTLPLVGAAAASAKAAIDWQTAFTGVKKTVEGTPEQLMAIGQQFRDMAKTIPVSTTELGRIGEAAGALGIKRENIAEFTRVMAALGVTTNLTSDQAADSFARIANVMQLPQTQFSNMASTVVALGNAGASTEAEIVNMAVNIAGAGAQVGMSAAEVLSFSSALSSVGMEAEAGGSSISRVLVEISKAAADGGSALGEFARVAGMSAEDYKAAFETNAANATIAFINGLGRIKTEGENVFGVLDGLELRDIRVQRSLLNASGAGALFADQMKIGTQAFIDNNALSDEANKRYETMASKLQVLWNRLTDVGITIGTSMMPAMNAAISIVGALGVGIEKAGNFFAKMPEPMRLTIVALGALAATIGPLLVGVGALTLGFAAMTASAPVVAAMSAIGVAFAYLTAAIVGAGGLATAWSVWGDTITTWLSGPWASFKSALSVVGEAVVGFGRKVAELIRPFADAAVSVATFFGKLAGWTVLTAFEVAMIGVRVAVGAVMTVWHGAVALATVLWEGLKWLGEAAKTVGTVFGTVFMSAIKIAYDTLNKLAGAVKYVFDTLSSYLPDLPAWGGATAAAGAQVADTTLQVKGFGAALAQLQPPIAAVGSGLKTTGAATMDFTGQLAETHKQVANLTAAQKENIRAGLEMGLSEKDIADKMKISEAAVRLYKTGIEDLTKTERKRVESAEENAKRMNALEGDIAKENAKFAAQAIAENDARLAKDREYYNQKGVAEIEAAGRAADATEKQKKDLRDYYNWLGERQMEQAAKDIAASKVWSNTWTDIASKMPSTILSAIQGGGSVLGSVGSMVGGSIGTSLVTTFGSTITGALGPMLGGAVNALIPGLGAMLGPLLQKLGSLFGPSKQEIGARKEVAAFEAQLHSLLTTTQKVEAGNVSWKMTVIAVRDAYIAMGKTEAEALAAVETLWQSSSQGAGATASAIGAVQSVLTAYQAQVTATSATTTTDFNVMKSTAQSYGIDLAALGPAFQSAMLSQAANKLYADFMVLRDGGADVGTVLVGMQDEITGLVRDADKFGIALPRSLKPIIDNLIESNSLTEDQRQMFVKVAELSWSGPVVGQVDEISGTLGVANAAADQLAGGFNTIAAMGVGAARAVADAFDEYLVPAIKRGEEAINGFNFGHSPGGLKEPAILAPKAAFAVGVMAAAMIADFGDAERSVNMLNDALVGTYAPVAAVSTTGSPADAGYGGMIAQANRAGAVRIENVIVLDGREVARVAATNLESILNEQGVKS